MKITLRDNGESKLRLRFYTDDGDVFPLSGARIDAHGKVNRMDASPVVSLSTETGEIEIDDAANGEAAATLSPTALSLALGDEQSKTLLFDVLVSFPSLPPRNAKEFSLTIVKGITQL